jgi:hypothetical protein
MLFSDTNREQDWTDYAERNLPQPTRDEVDELWSAGTAMRVLDNAPHPLPDVYAAACFIRRTWLEGDAQDSSFGYRGQRNWKWDLIPSIQRTLPTGIDELTSELERRRRALALFCEAMRQILGDRDPGELGRIAIAQHYGIPSPLIDLTRSPWVALFFASDGGQAGEVGLFQRFSISSLKELAGKESRSPFGTVRIIDDVDFVPRIAAQHGFFIELPQRRLHEAMIPQTVSFRQEPGVVFEDDTLAVRRSLIYPSESNDPFAALADPRLKTYPSIHEPREPSAQEYLDAVLNRYNLHDEFQKCGPAVQATARTLCEFHARLQFARLRLHQRSLTALGKALSRLFVSDPHLKPSNIEDLVESYADGADDAERGEILETWDKMKLDAVAGHAGDPDRCR